MAMRGFVLAFVIAGFLGTSAFRQLPADPRHESRRLAAASNSSSTNSTGFISDDQQAVINMALSFSLSSSKRRLLQSTLNSTTLAQFNSDLQSSLASFSYVPASGVFIRNTTSTSSSVNEDLVINFLQDGYLASTTYDQFTNSSDLLSSLFSHGLGSTYGGLSISGVTLTRINKTIEPVTYYRSPPAPIAIPTVTPTGQPFSASLTAGNGLTLKSVVIEKYVCVDVNTTAGSNFTCGPFARSSAVEPVNATEDSFNAAKGYPINVVLTTTAPVVPSNRTLVVTGGRVVSVKATGITQQQYVFTIDPANTTGSFRIFVPGGALTRLNSTNDRNSASNTITYSIDYSPPTPVIESGGTVVFGMSPISFVIRPGKPLLEGPSQVSTFYNTTNTNSTSTVYDFNNGNVYVLLEPHAPGPVNVIVPAGVFTDVNGNRNPPSNRTFYYRPASARAKAASKSVTVAVAGSVGTSVIATVASVAVQAVRSGEASILTLVNAAQTFAYSNQIRAEGLDNEYKKVTAALKWINFYLPTPWGNEDATSESSSSSTQSVLDQITSIEEASSVSKRKRRRRKLLSSRVSPAGTHKYYTVYGGKGISYQEVYTDAPWALRRRLQSTNETLYASESEGRVSDDGSGNLLTDATGLATDPRLSGTAQAVEAAQAEADDLIQAVGDTVSSVVFSTDPWLRAAQVSFYSILAMIGLAGGHLLLIHLHTKMAYAQREDPERFKFTSKALGRLLDNMALPSVEIKLIIFLLPSSCDVAAQLFADGSSGAIALGFFVLFMFPCLSLVYLFFMIKSVAVGQDVASRRIFYLCETQDFVKETPWSKKRFMDKITYAIDRFFVTPLAGPKEEAGEWTHHKDDPAGQALTRKYGVLYDGMKGPITFIAGATYAMDPLTGRFHRGVLKEGATRRQLDKSRMTDSSHKQPQPDLSASELQSEPAADPDQPTICIGRVKRFFRRIRSIRLPNVSVLRPFTSFAVQLRLVLSTMFLGAFKENNSYKQMILLILLMLGNTVWLLGVQPTEDTKDAIADVLSSISLLVTYCFGLALVDASARSDQTESESLYSWLSLSMIAIQGVGLGLIILVRFAAAIRTFDEVVLAWFKQRRIKQLLAALHQVSYDDHDLEGGERDADEFKALSPADVAALSPEMLAQYRAAEERSMLRKIKKLRTRQLACKYANRWMQAVGTMTKIEHKSGRRKNHYGVQMTVFLDPILDEHGQAILMQPREVLKGSLPRSLFHNDLGRRWPLVGPDAITRDRVLLYYLLSERIEFTRGKEQRDLLNDLAAFDSPTRLWNMVNKMLNPAIERAQYRADFEAVEGEMADEFKEFVKQFQEERARRTIASAVREFLHDLFSRSSDVPRKLRRAKIAPTPTWPAEDDPDLKTKSDVPSTAAAGAVFDPVAQPTVLNVAADVVMPVRGPTETSAYANASANHTSDMQNQVLAFESVDGDDDKKYS